MRMGVMALMLVPPVKHVMLRASVPLVPRRRLVPLMVLAGLVLMAAGGYVIVLGTKAVPMGHVPVLRVILGAAIRVFVRQRRQIVLLMVLARLVLMAAVGHVPVPGTKAVPMGHAPVLRMRPGTARALVFHRQQFVRSMVLAGLMLMAVMLAAAVLPVKHVLQASALIVRRQQLVLRMALAGSVLTVAEGHVPVLLVKHVIPRASAPLVRRRQLVRSMVLAGLVLTAAGEHAAVLLLLGKLVMHQGSARARLESAYPLVVLCAQQSLVRV
jgi:hypothetical protein